MLYKKTATQYKKWDYFDDQEDDPEPEFIPPENDPNFKAMEQDMKERSEKRKLDLKAATELRDQGNQFFKEGKYRNAILKYEAAQDIKKDWMILYTNSAIARIKTEDYEGAVKDCTRVLEYHEVFENGYEKSKDVCFKALIRRGEALRLQEKFVEAVKDLSQALDLKEDPEIERILEICQQEATAHGQSLEEMKVEEIQQADTIIAELTTDDKVLSFRQSGGYVVLFKRIYESLDLEALLVLEFLTKDETKFPALEPLLAKVYDKRRTGAVVLLETIDKNLHNADIFKRISKILALCLENQMIREEVVKHSACTKGKKFCKLSIDVFLKRPSKSFSPIITNLCLSSYKSSFERKPNPGSIKAIVRHMWSEFYPAFQRLMDDPESLSEATALLCNLAVDLKLKSLCMSQHRLMTICGDILNKGNNSLQVERALGFFINCATVPAPLEKLDEHYELIISGVKRLISLQSEIETITYRSFLLLFRLLVAKIDLAEPISQDQTVMRLLFEALDNPKNIDISIKIITAACTHKKFCLQIPIPKLVSLTLQSVQQFLAGAKLDDRVGNLGLILGRITEQLPHISSQFKPCVEPLVNVVKEKLGPVRKNVAVGLGKLSKDSENRDELRRVHGIEILNSVMGHLSNK